MSDEPMLYHYVFNHEYIEVLQKMINGVANDSKKRMDVVFKPRSYQLEEENTPVIEIAEM